MLNLTPNSELNEAQGLDCGDTKTTEGFLKAQNTPGCYRLPSESEWEYVSRGGLPSEYAYGFGNDFHALAFLRRSASSAAIWMVVRWLSE